MNPLLGFVGTYKSHGLATVRYPVLEVTATVEPFDNGRGFSLRVLRAGTPRTYVKADFSRAIPARRTKPTS